MLLAALVGGQWQVEAQTARQMVLPNSADSLSEMHVFLPEQPTGKAIVMCPGGGYSHLAFRHEGLWWTSWFNAQGMACIVVKYRLPEGNPELPVGDVERAIVTVRDSAASWHVNPHDVGIMGFSAGGHLAATVSTIAPPESRPDYSVLVYPVISMDPTKGHRGSSEHLLGDKLQDADTVLRYSPAQQISRETTPPTLLMLSSDDRTVPPVTNAVEYYSQLQLKGCDCAMLIYPTGGHGWGFKEKFRFHESMLGNLKVWLEAHPAKTPIE